MRPRADRRPVRSRTRDRRAAFLALAKSGQVARSTRGANQVSNEGFTWPTRTSSEAVSDLQILQTIVAQFDSSRTRQNLGTPDEEDSPPAWRVCFAGASGGGTPRPRTRCRRGSSTAFRQGHPAADRRHPLLLEGRLPPGAVDGADKQIDTGTLTTLPGDGLRHAIMTVKEAVAPGRAGARKSHICST